MPNRTVSCRCAGMGPLARAFAHRYGAVLALVGAGLLLLAGAGLAQEPAAPRATASASVAYEPELVGVDDSDLADLLTATSHLFSLSDRAPATLAGLERRTENDLERLQTALRSEGYYAARVAAEIDPETDPVSVSLRVAPGPQYTLARYEIDYLDAPPDRPPGLDEIGIELEEPARAPEIVAAEQTIVVLLGRRGHPFARITSRDVVVDHDTRTLTVTVAVDAGPAAVFGPVSVTGLEDVAPEHIDALIEVPEGDPFDRRELTNLRRTLSRTGLFTSIAVVTPSELVDERLPVMVTVRERKHRSVGAGASFSTDAGFGGRVSWVHRNVFNHGERVRLAISGDQLEQIIEASFRKPVFLRPDQELLANLSAGRRETDAFDEEFIDGLIGVERLLDEFWRAGVGASAEISRVESSTGRTEFAIFGVPLTLGFDSTSDPLDPVSGFSADLTVTPKLGTNSSASSALTTLTTIAALSAYYPIDPKTNYVLAGRLRLGSNFGEEFSDLPVDQRLFAGGANSIRGYEFQRAGPLDANGDPTGGRSLIDFGAEFRARVLENWGFVVFADGGGVSQREYFDPDDRLFFAAGAGLRYYTRVGPVRFDIAFPLNGRDGVDDLFQFYVSFGQAF